MDILILGAGYATRLYPLTLNQPKPLLPVAGKPMVNHVLDNLSGIEGIEKVFVVTNAKFTPHFEAWAKEYQKESPFFVKIINDGSTDEANRLGAIGDINFVIQKEKISEDLLIVAGDNLFSKTLKGFGKFCRKKNAPVLGVYDVGNLEEIKKYNSISIDEQSKITFFEEKPKNPTSTITGIALYYYPKQVLPMIKQYVDEGNNPDQPGRLVQWLYTRTPVYTWKVPGIWYDIGSKESLEEANRIFSNLESAK
jgi:glucose-1-phosphate thymidylyltransferase